MYQVISECEIITVIEWLWYYLRQGSYGFSVCGYGFDKAQVVVFFLVQHYRQGVVCPVVHTAQATAAQMTLSVENTRR